MDIKEILFGKDSTPELKARQIWTDSYFTEYLTALTRGKQFLEPTHHFPDTIELNDEWHRSLEQIRRATEVGLEHWALIGFKEDRRDLYLPEFPFEGEPGTVPTEVLISVHRWASEKHNVANILGDIHSHPYAKQDHFNRINPATYERFQGSFSAGDLYGVVCPLVFLPLRVLVDGNENLFVFQTKETQDTIFTDMEQFSRYWYEKCGIKYLGTDKNGQHIQVTKPDASIWKVNLVIAKRHNLVIYKGTHDKNIYRVTPK